MVISRFTSYKATQHLKHLALEPFDLATPNALTPSRIEHFVLEGVGFKLFYATERVTDNVMDSLYELAEESGALHEMERMQAGEVMNCIHGYPSENRAVLHTSLRDFFDVPQTSKTSMEATRLAKVECDKLQNFLPDLQAFNTLVIIGIGGSELGPKALYLALEAYKEASKKVEFLGNVDPDACVQLFSSLDLTETLVCVVSKSGTTLETATNEAFARSLFEAQGINSDKHFIAITGEGSPMDDPQKYLKSFYIWDWIGGRYSGSSIIGGVIIAFACGFDTYMEFLKGAHAMDQNALSKDLRKNLPLLGALLGIWNHNFLGIQTSAVIPYSQPLWRFSAHLQQLDMESNGKQTDRQGQFVDHATGPIIWGEPGTNAQHSFYQLIHQGTVPIALEMLGFKNSQLAQDFSFEGTTSQEKLLANLIAQGIALASGQKNDNPNKVFLGNRPSYLLIGTQLTANALGSLLSYFEHKAAFQGFIWNINSFDQEGVQLGKILANKIMNCFSGTEAYPLGESYIKQLRNL